jgi:2-polyprenyl-6-methoxyphenol hydroxylase-like FAD-dependent oxidoreductase
MTATYDIITVGGGLGGAALAGAMAERGYRVLVAERETQFKDRVRGEQVCSWGVADAIDLGIFDLLTATCGHELPWWDTYMMGQLVGHRDLLETTPRSTPNLTFYHPEMQEVMLRTAEEAGAEVRRGVRVADIKPGPMPEVTVENGRSETVRARLVVGADGRTSKVRKWGRFQQQQDPERLQIAGILVEGCSAPEDCAAVFVDPMGNGMGVLFPQGNQRVRTYAVTHCSGGPTFSGDKDIPSFFGHCIKAGMPAEWFEASEPNGPLATFNGADSYVPYPYKDGIALVGDAAATSDPAWGQGLSLTLRDVRMLRDKLLRDDDWDRAGREYAREHDRYYDAIHTAEDWYTRFFHTPGPEGAAVRAKVLPLMAEDRTRFPDTIQSGPESAELDEAARQRMFGLDLP